MSDAVNGEAFKLYKAVSRNYCLKPIELYKDDIIERPNVTKNMAFSAKIKKYMKSSLDDIEVLSF